MAALGLTLLFLQNLLIAYTATLLPAGELYICIGEPQTFLCSVPKLTYSAHLEWRIDFEDSRSVPVLIRQYTTLDEKGQFLRDERTGLNFEFNLTSNTYLYLESAMTVIAHNVNGTSVINNAVLHCGETAYLNTTVTAVFHVPTGPPHSPTNLNYSQMASQTFTRIQWGSVDSADYYRIDVSPTIMSVSNSISTNTSILLPLLVNREYNITVVASNCAGNSTPATIGINIGCCALPNVGSSVIIDSEDEGSRLCEVEGSHITYYCKSVAGLDERRVAFCEKNGSWNPSPSDLICHPINSGSSTNDYLDVSDSRVLIPSLTIALLVFSIITFLMGFLLGYVLLRYSIKRKTSASATATPPPVYEEILTTSVGHGHVNIVNNEAYGPII